MRSVVPLGADPSSEGPHDLRGVHRLEVRLAALWHLLKTYTEKVWGVPADQIQADWAAQRVKNLDLLRAIINSLAPRRNQKEITSLIEEFEYPRHGPGMMWERCHELVEGQGGEVHFHHAVSRIEHSDGLATAVIAETPAGEARFPCGDVVSSMPIPRLVQAMDPAPPTEVLAAADGLAFRDFLTVALVVPEAAGFPDNWIYIHAPDVEVGRVQNFRSWSPQMVPESGKPASARVFRVRRRRTLDVER